MIQGKKLMRTTGILPVIVAAAMLVALAGATPASAQAPWWSLDSTSASNFPKRPGEAQIIVTAANLGDAEVDATKKQVTFTDELPKGVKRAVAVEAVATRWETGLEGLVAPRLEDLACSPTPPAVTAAITCKFTQTLPPYERLIMRITVELEEPLPTPLENVVKVEGGNVPPASLKKRLQVPDGPTPFGVETYALTEENEDGSLDIQAGSHPFQQTVTLDFNQTLAAYGIKGEEGEYESKFEQGEFPTAPALPRNLRFKLPPGLVGDVTAVPQCSDVDFSTPTVENTVNLCPRNTVVGVASLIGHDPVPFSYRKSKWVVPVFNLVPAPGEPARFGFELESVPVILKTSVPSGGDYAVEASVSNISQAIQVLSSQVTFWGVPGDPRHDSARGWECLNKGAWYGPEPRRPCTPTSDPAPTPLLTLPTSCANPLTTTAEGKAWSGETFKKEGESPMALEGCGLLAFEPTISVEPEVHTASTPTGMTVGVHEPQPGLLAANGRASSAVKATTVALPLGVQASPGAAAGLLACSAGGVGFNGSFESSPGVINPNQNEEFSPDPVTCPDASKIGTVKVKTPLLERELHGDVYLASQDTNPFKSPLVLYVAAEDPVSGVRVKLAGTVTLDPVTGQLVSTFEHTPPLPFEDLTLNLFGGGRAAQSTPPLCGTYTTTASFTPWSTEKAVPASGSFAITSGPGGGPCPSNPLPFAPGFQAGSTSSQAGAFSAFTLQLDRPDGNQALRGLTVHMPPGVAAMLSSVTQCAEPPPGQEWSCGPESLIGHSTASSGLGGEPFTLGGQVYLTVGYGGAPFGTLVVTPAKAGPFDLGNVDVRAKIYVDPSTAAATVVSDPFPTIIKGVPVQLKHVNVNIDRPGFWFNPTNCNGMKIEGTLGGDEGATAFVSSPFQVANCANLPFAPKLTASAGGHASKVNGVGLVVKVESAGLGQADIAKVDLQLPKALPSRLTTIQKACPDGVFNANPAACNEGSVIGSATIHTPVLKSPLSGPAYLVSHGGVAFPDVEFVLQGEGITLILDGKTDIKNGITYSRFDSAPDAPFTTFETVLPAGPHSALGANLPAQAKYNLCATKLAMPTTITGQNGAVIEQTTKIAVTGCAEPPLAKALKACRKLKTKSKRVACEAAARKKYGAKKSSKSRSRKK